MDSLNSQEAEAVVRAFESAARVKRSFQFFVWLQSHFKPLVPHEIAICGAYHRSRRDLVLEAFNSTVVPAGVLDTLTDADSPLLRHVSSIWPLRVGHAARIDLGDAVAAGSGRDLLLDHGLAEIVVHGVSRPQRPNEIESLFMLLGREAPLNDRQVSHFEMLLPQLHMTYLRVQAAERESGGDSGATVSRAALPSNENITRREKQILLCVREGKSNQAIGESLEISALTVKNHIQKILRKLGAANRTHAVSRALALGLIDGSDDPGVLSRAGIAHD
jgi:transcriptional regulator EpsA